MAYSSSCSRPLLAGIWAVALALCPVACDSPGSSDDGPADRGPLGKADIDAGSCEIADCGGPAAAGICFCDTLCSDFGDCCGNYQSTCEAPASCSLDECADPFVTISCAPGTASQVHCLRDDAGVCESVGECIPVAGPCTPQECGAPPLITCVEGLVPNIDCFRDDADICGWSEAACVEPVPCAPVDCGPQPDDAQLCPDGSVVTADLCGETGDNSCAWQLQDCGNVQPGVGACLPGQCPPDSPLVIDCSGEVSHAADCERQPDGLCSWQAPTCP